MFTDRNAQRSCSQSAGPPDDTGPLTAADARALLRELRELAARYSGIDGPRRIHASEITDGMTTACRLAMEPAPVLAGMIDALETALETRPGSSAAEVVSRD